MLGTGFTVEPSTFLNLSPERAVSLFRQLLWAEAGRVGVGRHLIDVPECINVGDGGVDAYIDAAHPSSDHVIPEGDSVFQIKAADLRPTACKEELHVRGDRTQPLKSELGIRLGRGAAYVLVLFADITNSKRRQRCDAIRQELSQSGYPDTEVRVYTANQLAGFATLLPSLVALLRPELSTCMSYETWGSWADVRYPGAFVTDASRESLVRTLTGTLRGRTECPVIRLTGLPGVGKTRSVYEALRPDDLRHQVLYVRAATNLVGASLLYSIIRNPEASAILVVDECDINQHRELAEALTYQGPRLALITMSYERGSVPSPNMALNADPLDQAAIKDVLQQEYPDLPGTVAGRLAEFSDGYPRIAVLLADQYIKEGMADPYLHISDDRLMNRLIGGSASLDSAQFRVTETVLRGLSLFQRVGVTGIGEDEGRWLAEFIGVPWQEFRAVLAQQRERGIVQGESYVFITPFMLRVHLLERWWEAHGFRDQHSLEEFVASMPTPSRADLLRRFVEHFYYIAGARRGAEFARAMLAEGGAFSDYDLLNSEIGARLFLALTEADPDSALKAAQRLIGNKSRDELLDFRLGRRATVDALRRMAMWRQLFQPAARLLLALGEAETESWSNNASGEFANLFGLGIREVASSEAPPEVRIPILQEAISSKSPERRRLGLQACRRALSGDFSRVLGVERQGIRREPNLWSPTTYGEWYEAYRPIWELTVESLSSPNGSERDLALEVLLSSARSITSIEWLADMVIHTFRRLAKSPMVDRRDLIVVTTSILHYDGKMLTPETRLKWEQLESELLPGDFGSRMERFVAMELLEDHFDAEGNQVDQAQPQIESLAEEAIKNPSLLNAEMHWLVTERAASGHRFGYELGKRDTHELVLAGILDALMAAGKDTDLSFAGGYLRAVAERAPDRWESLLDRFSGNAVQAGWVAELTWRSARLSEESSRRLLNLIRRGNVDPQALHVFMYGGLVRSLSPEDFAAWIEVLLAQGQPNGAAIALDLLVMYGKQPKELTLRILSHPSWFRTPTGNMAHSHDRYWWATTAESLCKRYPEVALQIARQILEHFGETGSVADGFAREPRRILDMAMEYYPEEVWKLVSPMLGPPIDGRAFHLTDWLRGSNVFEAGGSHVLERVPHELIWEWAEGDPEGRLPYLARFVPKVMSGALEAPCLARELLLRYGSDPKVRNELRANFSTEGWRGARSQHLETKLSWLSGLRGEESNPNVLAWIDEYTADIEFDLGHARQEEEREG